MVQEYPDQTVTDNFRIVRKLDSQEDVEGNCYDWYEIDRHYRTMDKTGPLVDQVAQLQEEKAVLEDTICELDSSTDGRITNAEDSICELDILVNELMNGGVE